jgi:replicative DNA helicase
LASSGKKSSNRFEEVGQLAYDLKAMAKSCGVAVIALSQLSREVERESPRRPQMSHLLESGKIEAAADKILYLYRPAYYGPDECEKAGFPTEDECSGFIEIGLLKQRAGKPRGKTVVNFVGQYTIADLTPHQWHIYSQAEARIQR